MPPKRVQRRAPKRVAGMGIFDFLGPVLKMLGGKKIARKR